MTIVADENHAPGRKRMVRANARVNVYWVASPAAVKAGYRPKTVPLNDDPGDVVATLEIAARCRALWAEMLEFMAGTERGPSGASIGTIAWVVDLYQTDQDSPYRRVRPATRPGYDRALAIVSSTVGDRRLDTVTANDVRRWFKNWGRAGEDGTLANPRRAYWCLQMLRISVKYGKGLRNPACRDLSEIPTDTEFPAPKGRRQAMSADQAAAIVAKAHELGWPNLARAVALQFGCALRQKDVIGEWVKASGGGAQWTSGLLWGEHVMTDWRLEKPTSKSNFSEVAEFDLRLLPMVMAELQRIPSTSRIGPVILDERTGKPYRQREFARRFREVARAAGVPDSIWNMDARAGAVTDAYDKGAREVDAMDLGTHTQLATNRRYSRNRLAATSRVAVLRFGPKNEPGKEGA
jgi:hypothetical protein